MKLTLAILAAALAVGSASAAPPAKPSDQPPRNCFFSRDIRNHTVGDAKTLYLKVGQDKTYRVGMSNNCAAAAFSNDPIVTRQPPGSSAICRPIDLDISIARAGGGFNSPCIVDSLKLLTPAEVEALPKKIRP